MTDLAEKQQTPTIAPLLKSILDDMQCLFSLEMKLVQSEFQQGLEQIKAEGFKLSMGIAAAIVGLVFLCLSFADVLQIAMQGAPLWISYAALGILVELFALILLMSSRETLKDD